MKTPYNPNRPEASRRGFALIITIVLVAFLVLILVGLATFTRVETQVADNSQQVAKARQNALLALNIAVGQLQKTTGPDQRVTATADLQPLATVANPSPYPTSDPASGENLAGSASGAGNPLEKIDDYWKASRNRHWVGAWKNGNTSSFEADEPVKFNPVPTLEAWLVSGNETVADQFKPTDAVSGLTFTAVNATGAAVTAITGARGDYRLLVGKNTAGIAAAADLGRAVVAPQIEIKSDAVPGIPGDQTVGHYAWWVGDEGVKAKANIIDAYSSSPDAEDNRTRLQSAQRPVIEAINTNLENIYKADDAAFQQQIKRIVGFDQLGFTAPNPSDLNDYYRPRFHDLTIFSQGVLSDTKRGGLKGDFSKILGQASDTTARDDLRDVTGNSLLSLSDNILTPATTVYATAPSAFTNEANSNLGLVYTPTWAQLRSFFNMGNATAQSPAGVMVDASGSAALSRVQTQTTQGIGPQLVQVKLFFGLEIDGANAVHLKVRPLVVLANPYNIELRGTWWLRVSNPALDVRMGDFGPSTTPTTPPSYPESSDLTLFPSSNPINGFRGRLNLVFRDAVLPPGKAVVFCLDQDYNDPASSATPLELKMVQGLNELNTFKWKTGVTYTAPTAPAVRYAALYASQSKVDARLYGADPAGNTNQEENLLTAVISQPPSGLQAACFFVPPITGGSADGGGTWFVMRDSLRTDADSGVFVRQMSPFIQFNYRALYNLNTGYGGTPNHLLEPARTYNQKNASTAPDAFKNDLLIDGSGDYARWGPVTKGTVTAATTTPSGVGSDTGFTNILYDLPRPQHPLSSFGQLQHFNPAGFIKDGKFPGSANPGDTKGFTVLANTFQLNYPMGNSYVNPWMPRHLVLNAEGKAGIQYDGSWLFNESLADRFFFSSYPATGNFDFDSDKLVNARLKPFRDRATVAWDDEPSFRGGPRLAAKNLLLDGAFNINSTSVEAWKAVLSATREVPVGGDSSVNVGFARTLYQPEKYNSARDGASKDAWAGYTNLSDAEIDKLAREIVLQIHRRGPFLSLADFYNRQLVARADDPAAFKLGVTGALQSAIDAILNQQSDVDSTFRVQSDTGSFPTGEATDYRMRTMTAGSPGYLLQGDVLSTLAPSLSARSDTFVIRTYGDAYNPATGETTGQAWCEAVVQRLPDYVDKTDAAESSDSALNATNKKFGRRYEVVSFRWLSPDDI